MFAGRKWQSQKQAEDAFKANFGRNWEGRLTEAQKNLAEREAEIQALRRALSTGEQGQGAARGVQAKPAADPNAPLAEQLVQSQDLDFLVSLLETREGEDPTAGVKRFTLGLAQTIDQAVNAKVQAVQEQHIQPILRQRAFEQGMHSTMGVVRQLATSDFPELDEANQSPEAVEHQQAFVENLKQFPPDFVRENPQFAMLATALLTRYQQGTPVFAQMPGTSGSPSARAVAASAQALGTATPAPLDGTGTPRPRPGGVETPEDRLRRENAAAPGNFRSPSGRDLGFGPA